MTTWQPYRVWFNTLTFGLQRDETDGTYGMSDLQNIGWCKVRVLPLIENYFNKMFQMFVSWRKKFNVHHFEKMFHRWDKKVFTRCNT